MADNPLVDGDIGGRSLVGRDFSSYGSDNPMDKYSGVWSRVIGGDRATTRGMLGYQPRYDESGQPHGIFGKRALPPPQYKALLPEEQENAHWMSRQASPNPLVRSGAVTQSLGYPEHMKQNWAPTFLDRIGDLTERYSALPDGRVGPTAEGRTPELEQYAGAFPPAPTMPRIRFR